MLKKNAFRRISIATMALIIVLIIYFFPSKESTMNMDFSYTESNKIPIYLIDSQNYVARTTIVNAKTNTIEIAKDIIDALTIDSVQSTYLPNGFKGVIPKGTTIIDISLDDSLLKINFSKEFYEVTEEDEEKMIETLIYSIIELKDVEKIMIFVENKQLTNLPNSGKSLPNTLDKSFGINKVYDLKSLKETTKTTTYYLSKYNDFYYYVPVTTVSNTDKERIEVIVEQLKSAPIYHTNLMSYLAASTSLLNYEFLEDTISLSFNNYVLANLDDKDILEEVKYCISLSIRDTYQISNIIFNVEDEKILEFSLD